MGRQCQELSVALRIGTLEAGPGSLDHESTWLLGHTEQISFGLPRAKGNDLLVDARLHVACRYFKTGRAPRGNDAATAAKPELPVPVRCTAHGFSATLPPADRGKVEARQLGGNRFQLVEQGRLVEQEVVQPRRALPVLAGDNPCATAPCTTADHRRGSACCRDLQVEIICPRTDTTLEALVRSRKSPYLCKIIREVPQAIEAEMISACGYLDPAGRNCTLHGRKRPDGRPAKPDLCSEWPDDGKGLHPGCIFPPSVPKT